MRWRLACVCILAVMATSCLERLVGSDPANTPAALFDLVWKDFDRNYSFFDVRGVDWNDVRARYESAANAAVSPDAVAPIIGQMLTELRDPHVDLFVPPNVQYHSVFLALRHTYFSWPAVFSSYVRPNFGTRSGSIRYGMITPTVGYLWIGSFGGSDWSGEIDQVLESFGGAASVIIDVRDNAGGSTYLAESVAARFMDTERVFAYVRWRNGPAHGDFSEFVAVQISPAGRRFAGTVVVLTNRKVVSAAEHFVLAMRSRPDVVIVGDTTAGGFGNPMIRELPNGWVYRLPQWIEYGPGKEIYEGIGLAPGVVVPATAADSSAGRDVQLERALALARGT